MPETWMTVAAGGLGLLVGLVHFAALWWTARVLVHARHPAALLLGSLVLRMALVVAALALATRGAWPAVLACGAGLIVARVTVQLLVRPLFSPAMHPGAGGGDGTDL